MFLVLTLLACGTTPSCPDDALPDGDACVPRACGAGPWGTTAGDAIYVAEGGQGTGGMDDPLGSLNEAIAEAIDRGQTQIRLGAGRFTERLNLAGEADDLEIRGRCAALSTLVAPDDEGPLLTVDMERSGQQLLIADLSLEGGLYGVAVSRGVLTLEDAAIVGAQEVGLFVDRAASAQLARVEIRDTRASEEGYRSAGIVVYGGDLVAEDLDLQRNAQYGIYQEGGAVSLERARVEGSLPIESAGRLQDGIGVRNASGTLEASGLVLAENTAIGLVIEGRATLEDLEVWGTLPGPSFAFDQPDGGLGVGVWPGAILSATGLHLHENTQVNLQSYGETTLTDGLIESARTTALADSANGLVVKGGHTVGERLLIRDCRWHCVWLANDGTTLTLRDSALQDNDFSGEGGPSVLAADAGTTLEAEGLRVSGGVRGGLSSAGAVDLRSSAVYDNQNYGISLGGSAQLRDLRISDTRPLEDFFGSGSGLLTEGASIVVEGLSVERSGSIGIYLTASTGSLSRVLLDDNRNVGLFLVASTVRLEDAQVSHTRPGISDGSAIYVLESQLSASGLRVLDNQGYGLFVRGGEAELHDVEIARCERGGNYSAVHGLIAYYGAKLRAESLFIHDNEGPGLTVAGGTLDCDRCTIQDNEFAGVTLSSRYQVSLSDSSISGNLPHPNEGGGFGVYVATSTPGDSFLLRDSVVGPHEMAGVLLRGEASFALEDNRIEGSDSARDRRPAGQALIVVDATTVSLRGNTFANSQTEAVLLHRAGVDLGGNLWQANAQDLLVQGGGCPDAEALLAEPALSLSCPEYDLSVDIPTFMGAAFDVTVTP